MAQTVYEGMFILDSGRYGRDPQEVSGRIPKMIQDSGGEILVSRLWEERRLAYPIKGQRKGTYWLTYFQIDGVRISELTRKCRLTDGILRQLFVKVDPRIVETLVEHAKSGTSAPARRATHAPEKVKDKAPSDDSTDGAGESTDGAVAGERDK